jgi:hypothetical protein
LIPISKVAIGCVMVSDKSIDRLLELQAQLVGVELSHGSDGHSPAVASRVPFGQAGRFSRKEPKQRTEEFVKC